MAEIKDLYHSAGRGRWKRRHPLVINQSGENNTDYLSLLEEAGSLNVGRGVEKPYLYCWEQIRVVILWVSASIQEVCSVWLQTNSGKRITR